MKTKNVELFVDYNNPKISGVVKLSHPTRQPVTRLSDEGQLFGEKDVNLFRTIHALIKTMSVPKK